MKKNCPYCQTESGIYFRSRDYNRHITSEVFSHYRCPQCSLIFLSPVPQNLGDYYPQDYYAIPRTLDSLRTDSRREHYKLETVQRFVGQGRLLEIGPAFGSFSYLAQQAGFETQAIEMDKGCSVFLNEVAGIPTINTLDVCSAISALKPFDVVAMWQVIEHLPNPWETLEAISAKINPGGILVLAAPNPDAFQFRLLRRYWPHVDAPRHLMLIPASLLVEKMAKLGMKAEWLTTTDAGSVAGNIFGWVYFFSNLCGHPAINPLLTRIGHRMARWLRPIDGAEGKGSAYTIVWRKPAA